MGSFLGLLMGCSLLTVCEIIDLIIYFNLVKCIERWKDRRRPLEMDVREIGDDIVVDIPGTGKENNAYETGDTDSDACRTAGTSDDAPDYATAVELAAKTGPRKISLNSIETECQV